MKLRVYQQLIQTENQENQLKILGYDPEKVKVADLEDILKGEYSQINFNYQPEKDYFKVKNRIFKVKPAIEEMNINDYSIYKSIEGYVYGDTFNDETDEVVEVEQEEKMKRLILNLHKILALTTDEKTWFKKKLTIDEKVELFLDAELNDIFFFIKSYLVPINNLQKNIENFYTRKKRKKETAE